MIGSIDVYGYTLRYRHGEYVMSSGRAAATETGTAVRLTTTDGRFGWGEITPLGGTYLPTFTGAVRAGLHELGPKLVGVDPHNLSLVHRVMDSVLLGQAYAKSPIDIACWDLKAQSAGVPVSALPGGTLQAGYPIYEPVPLGRPGEMADYITSRRAAGVNRFRSFWTSQS